jgi:hypothetical protein
MENSRQIILDKFNDNEKAITDSIKELSILRDELHNLRMTYSKSNETKYFHDELILISK